VALLEVRDISVRFGGVTAVDGATFNAEAGRVTGLIGPNGAGKTTLFNVVSGLQPPNGGRVVYRGRNLRNLPPSTRSRGGIGRTFQRLEAFGSLTVRENVLVAIEIHDRGIRRGASAEHRRRADHLLHRVGIQDFSEHRADQVPTAVARLLEVARALATGPRLLLLDEPSSGLTPAETRRFGSLLRDLAAQGRAVVIVEHDMSLVMSCCDDIHVLDFGRIIASGTPEEVRGNRRVRRAYLGYERDEVATPPAGTPAVPAAADPPPAVAEPAAPEAAATEPARKAPGKKQPGKHAETPSAGPGAAS
jgi:branched-chain amino acid transport system ATP-binding protein